MMNVRKICTAYSTISSGKRQSRRCIEIRTGRGPYTNLNGIPVRRNIPFLSVLPNDETHLNIGSFHPTPPYCMLTVL